MCTLTWWRGANAYEVFFNRDERVTRPEALPPEIGECAGVRFVAPVDIPSGGTWIFGNEAGVTLAILNYYEKEEPDPPEGLFRSRGQLVWSLASCTSLEEVGERLAEIDPAQWNAFTILAFDEGRGGASGMRVWKWVHDREALRGPERAPSMPVSSSSFDPERVVAARLRAFARLVPAGEPVEPDGLERYHHWDGEGRPGPETVVMQRPDARTWSISRVRMTPGQVTFVYEAVGKQPPIPPETRTLERRPRG